MAEVNVAVLDALNSLLEGEQASLIRFMGEGSPYLSRATAEVRRPLAEMVQQSQGRAGALYQLIDQLGGTPTAGNTLQPEDQYLAFLSLKFLLPKLATDKQLLIKRYENTLRAIGKQSPPAVADLLQSQLEAHRRELARLQQASEDVLKQGAA